MSTPNALGDSSGSAPPYWPQDAVPEHWITELFKRMHRLWGNTFVDKWRDVEMAGMKIEWAKALKKLSSAELKAGVDALLTLKFPPSLPEFYGLCKQMRLVEMPRAEAITNQAKADPSVVHANMQRMREIMAPMMKPREATAEWAYQLLMRGEQKNGKGLSFEGIRCASDAISSKAGQVVIENCTDEALRAEYQTIRSAIVSSYRDAGKPLWETS